MIRVFGITGTNGKTTASWMLRNILERSVRCGLIGTIEHITGSLHHMPVNTTPGRDMLAQLFREMSESGIKYCVMEVSSHGIAQGRIDGTEFTAAGFTNLSRDHLDYHGNMEDYYQTKKKLFLRENLYTAVNLDDGYGRRLYKELTEIYGRGKIVSFSLTEPAVDYYGKVCSTGLQGTVLEIYEQDNCLGEITVPIPGRHFVSDAMLAAVMALREGVCFEDVRMGILASDKISGRMEKTGDIEDTLGIVDYAHTPDSLEKLMETVNGFRRCKVICVFGCGGYRDKGKRKLMGNVAGRYSDYCIITNDNPRGEPPENILQAIEDGVYETGCGYCIIPDRYQAIKRAVTLAGKWDIIVVAGKGHETYQISGNECIPFNDREVLKELLEKKYEKTYDETN